MLSLTQDSKKQQAPRIYVADLAAYNEGILYGTWIDATLEAEDIKQEVKEMLKKSPTGSHAEEWAIHDYEGFEGINIEEWASFETVSGIAQGLTSGEHEPWLISIVFNHLGSGTTIDNAIEFINDNYQGSYENLEDWAYHFLEDTGQLAEIPKHLSMYIDFNAYARDAELNGDIFTIDDWKERKIHVFHNV